MKPYFRCCCTCSVRATRAHRASSWDLMCCSCWCCWTVMLCQYGSEILRKVNKCHISFIKHPGIYLFLRLICLALIGSRGLLETWHLLLMYHTHTHNMKENQCPHGQWKYEKVSVVKGCHLYKSIWMPVIGQELLVKPEDNNKLDKHTVSVIMSDHTVGHIPHTISQVSLFFFETWWCNCVQNN